jgi:hypothetical protein
MLAQLRSKEVSQLRAAFQPPRYVASVALLSTLDEADHLVGQRHDARNLVIDGPQDALPLLGREAQKDAAIGRHRRGPEEICVSAGRYSGMKPDLHYTLRFAVRADREFDAVPLAADMLSNLGFR